MNTTRVSPRHHTNNPTGSRGLLLSTFLAAATSLAGFLITGAASDLLPIAAPPSRARRVMSFTVLISKVKGQCPAAEERPSTERTGPLHQSEPGFAGCLKSPSTLS